MADVTGPIGSLPGARHNCPAGMSCDDCGAPAVKRIQGETDSFGCEMIDLCQSCFDKMQQSIVEAAAEDHVCDWCNAVTTDCRNFRDADEGRAGPVYMVCAACRSRDAEKWAEEAAECCGTGDDSDDEPVSRAEYRSFRRTGYM